MNPEDPLLTVAPEKYATPEGLVCTRGPRNLYQGYPDLFKRFQTSRFYNLNLCFLLSHALDNRRSTLQSYWRRWLRLREIGEIGEKYYELIRRRPLLQLECQENSGSKLELRSLCMSLAPRSWNLRFSGIQAGVESMSNLMSQKGYVVLQGVIQ